ncbi:acyl carrier protein [Micromonospora sp. RP3T]|uniref:acyl carrier protein n=1 Tax=Micromonospora sp. RP3T TaxID=2135446 RepID=UPI000D163B84|nr:acyl carrier protein [Micromonospora sp. RP3T]PTA47673.1 acyl carrier protein [Micromonospora sp. RP3T]
METIDDFLLLVETELGLRVTSREAARSFDELTGWDSMNLLALIAAVERNTGRSVSLARVLEAANLEEVYLLTVRGAEAIG